MRCFLKKFFSFLLTFLFSIFSANLFSINHSSVQHHLIEQKFVLANSKEKGIGERNCIPAKPKLEMLEKNILLEKLYEKSEKRQQEIKVWLKQNADSSTKMKYSKRKELDNLEKFQQKIVKEITELGERLTLEDFRKAKNIETQNLLYLEDCY